MDGFTCGRIFCAVLLLGGISVRKSGAQRLEDGSYGKRAVSEPNVPLALGSSANLSNEQVCNFRRRHLVTCRFDWNSKKPTSQRRVLWHTVSSVSVTLRGIN